MGDYVKVDLVHSLYKKKKWREIRLNKFETIENIKRKIYTHTGTPHDNMNLYAYDEFNIDNTQVSLSNDKLCLNDYNVKDNYTIYIQERNNSVTNDIMYKIDDEQELQKFKHLKYEMNDDEYDKRPDSFRTFLRQLREKRGSTMASGEVNETVEHAKSGNSIGIAEGIDSDMYDRELYKVGKRCRIKIGDRRGMLQFVGKLKNSEEIFVGVDLDEPLGNSDGTYRKKFLFQCKGKKYGYVGNINSIEMGDFPPFDIMDLEEF
ncbi:tubulin-specific chaperone, putative [Plasmodium ovale]|uniref:CAP-Gly domain-containing protein n=2 Tax=Plasmodium ovale TaxID=36330 RepID=A0A1A8VMJ2_PLAOA|nr:hypothetical protein POVCU2_0012380 [Plasmodium ovale curtisi]SBS84808.1 hypothetical protein POVCU1_011450 [Plasmodium ovale curtisi]SCQ16058.1 tubulin-specific chaperone, putative [Plasmodium ovale]